MHENFNINMLNCQLNQFENKNQYQIQLSNLSDGFFRIRQIIKSMRIKITIENVYLTGVILIIGI